MPINRVTGVHISYFHICHFKLWLFAHDIQMEFNSDLVYEGKMIHEYSYSDRSVKTTEIMIDGCRIDFYDPKKKIIHEIKKTKKMEKAHQWQLKYYIYILKKNGIEGVKGILEYPKLREKKEIIARTEDFKYLDNAVIKIKKILNDNICPNKEKTKICKSCSYYDFCWINEG